MRHHVVLNLGQVWQLSDPRRLSAFRILYRHHNDRLVNVVQVYPQAGLARTLEVQKFFETGPKGYTRIS